MNMDQTSQTLIFYFIYKSIWRGKFNFFSSSVFLLNELDSWEEEPETLQRLQTHDHDPPLPIPSQQFAPLLFVSAMLSTTE